MFWGSSGDECSCVWEDLLWKEGDRGWACFWEVTLLWPLRKRRLGEGEWRRRGGFFGTVAAVFSPRPLTTRLSLPVVHVNPLLFCLKFLIGAEGQVMILRPQWGERLHLNQIKTRGRLSWDSLSWLPVGNILAAGGELSFYTSSYSKHFRPNSAALIRVE